MAEQNAIGFLESASRRLTAEWNGLPISEVALAKLPSEIVDAVHRSINSRTLTYRYVLPTQLLAKLVDKAIDCRAIQVASGLKRAFDARSLCHEVIVRFDREHNNVLGGSTEPYANNPLRIPSITAEYRGNQRNKSGFDDLRTVLDFAQENPKLIENLYRVVVAAMHTRLAGVVITYPVPNRASLKQALAITGAFLQERTGGTRLQAIGLALFRSVGEQFKLFADVKSANINAADSSTGSAADLECIDGRGDVIVAVEIKDRRLRNYLITA